MLETSSGLTRSRLLVCQISVSLSVLGISIPGTHTQRLWTGLWCNSGQGKTAVLWVSVYCLFGIASQDCKLEKNICLSSGTPSTKFSYKVVKVVECNVDIV